MSTVKPYEIEAVPERDGDDGSRFFLQTSPGGFATDPAANIAAVYSHLVYARQQEAVGAAPPEIRVELYAVIHESSGYRLKRRGVLLKPKVYEANRPTKAASLTLSAGALLDSLLTGEGEGWDRARDQDCWRALLQVAEFHGLTGRALRNINEHVARCLAVRAGIKAPHPSALPQEHLMAEPRSLPDADEPADEQGEAA